MPRHTIYKDYTDNQWQRNCSEFCFSSWHLCKEMMVSYRWRAPGWEVTDLELPVLWPWVSQSGCNSWYYLSKDSEQTGAQVCHKMKANVLVIYNPNRMIWPKMAILGKRSIKRLTGLVSTSNIHSPTICSPHQNQVAFLQGEAVAP